MGRCGILLIAVFVMALFGAEPIAAQSITGLSELSAAKRKTSNPQRAANDDDKNGDEKKGNGKDDQPDTEHIFGFTTGTDIGEVGESEVEVGSRLRRGKRDGSYTAASNQIELGHTPLRNFRFALGGSLAYHNIHNVTGLDDRNQTTFEGVSFEAKFRLIERELAGIGLTFIVEPGWARVNETSGARVSKFGTEFKLAADAELVKERIYGAFNLLYEPERERDIATGEVEKESTFGLFSALSFQAAKGVFLGGEIRYFRRYEGLGLDHRVGQALFVGPTFYAKLSERFWIAAAWSVQVAGRSVDNPDQRLDLDNFSRHEIGLQAGIEF
jgi:hypothetical protein